MHDASANTIILKKKKLDWFCYGLNEFWIVLFFSVLRLTYIKLVWFQQIIFTKGLDVVTCPKKKKKLHLEQHLLTNLVKLRLANVSIITIQK
jgi:hypothetical protein